MTIMFDIQSLYQSIKIDHRVVTATMKMTIAVGENRLIIDNITLNTRITYHRIKFDQLSINVHTVRYRFEESDTTTFCEKLDFV